MMNLVSITLNGKNYQLSCDKGKENQLLDLASSLNKNLSELKTHNPKASSELLLLMTALNLQNQILNSNINPLISNNKLEETEILTRTINNIKKSIEELDRKINQ